MTSSWMAERDRLLAQANSLVKTVNAARPAPSASDDRPHDRPLTPQPRPASSAPATAYTPSTMKPRSVNEGEADHHALSVRRNLRSDAQSGQTIPIPMLAGNERDDIEIRVARFRERQTKLAMERQAYSAEAQSVIKSKLLRNKDEC